MALGRGEGRQLQGNVHVLHGISMYCRLLLTHVVDHLFRTLKEASVSEEEELEEEEDASEEASGADPEDSSIFTAATGEDDEPTSTVKSKRPKLVVSSDEE